MATSQFSSHQVDILFNSDPICAGTLISSYLVLTVLSCLKGKNETKFKVRASQSDAAGNFQTRNVETIHSFPALKSEPSENDIAVILLEADFSLGESFRSISMIDFNDNATKELFAVSSSSSPSCGNIPVEKTEQSDCGTVNQNLICLKVAQKPSCRLPVSDPVIGSGLICQVHGLNFLCGALAGSGATTREYVDISKYLHWIHLTFQTRTGDEGDSHHVNGLGSRSFRGREVSSSGVSTSIPYQLSLQERRRGVWHHICGAIIIDTKTALTAAHCFDKNFGLSEYRVVAGVTHLNSTSSTKQILPLQKVLRHLGYQLKTWFLRNDIAIIHVNGSFVYNENVQNIWISPPNGTNPTDFTGRISGWGKTSRTGEPSNFLQEADMKILPDSECKKTWTFLTPSMICSYDKHSNFCEGDAGGPLVIQNYQFNQETTRDILIGIGSFSPGNCEKRDEPNAFTEVRHFSDWIQENRGLKCGATEFQCLNGQCIDECSLCDGLDECGDGSDEEEKQCPLDLEKKVSCLQKKQERYEKLEEELKNVIETKNQKIQELEDLVKTLKKTIGKISEKIEEKVCLDGVDSSEVTFYEDKDFAGSQTKVKVGCSCQEIPEEWKNRVSSLKSSSCVTFFRGKKCTNLSQQQQLTGSQADLNSYNLDNQVSSFELCAATAERPQKQTMKRSQGLGQKTAGHTPAEQIPYLVSLQYQYGTWRHGCEAVLIDEKTALTPAHCFDKMSKSTKYRVVAGTKNLHGNTTDGTTRQILPIQKITKHFNYKSFYDGNDIALVLANGSFTFNDNVNRVWISATNDPILSDFNGTTSFWAKTNNSLIRIPFKILSNEECKSDRRLSFLKRSMICGQNDVTPICGQNAGGPLVLENFEYPDGSKRDLLVGITSFGPNDCRSTSSRPWRYGFTRISSFYDWLDHTWKRNTSLTDPKQFKCFNGEEIDEDFRCDEEFDCADGSDEKGCRKIKDEARPKTQSCGGEIQLVDEHDIIYRVEDSEPGKMIQCVWTIFNKKNNPMQLTLLKNNNSDAQFDPHQNQSQLIALHNFTLQNFDYNLLTRTDQKIRIADSFTTLIFRGPAGTQNSGSGFHLRVKSVGLNKVKNPLKFKRVDLNSTSTLQNHSYPSSGFYGVNERVFTILPPSQNGSRIRLNLAFGEMEGNRDWFDIISIGQEPKSLFRLSGARSWINNTNTIEGGPDESLFVFMSTGSPAVKRKGLRFTYSEF